MFGLRSKRNTTTTNSSKPIDFILRSNTENSNNITRIRNRKESIFSDISINVGVDKYTLNKAILASKSNHFYKLFVQENPYETITMEEITMDAIESDIFHIIVGIIYGDDLQSVANHLNFVSLFMGMDFLEMEIDLKVFVKLLDQFDDTDDAVNSTRIRFNDEIFLLFNSIEYGSYTCLKHSDYRYLLQPLRKYFSDNLLQAFKNAKFLSLSSEGIYHILMNETNPEKERVFISRVCAEWICHDFDNRIQKMASLVNVTKFRYGCRRPVISTDEDSFLIQALKNKDPAVRTESVEEYFKDLLFYNYGHVLYLDPLQALLRPIVGSNNNQEIANRIDEKKRWIELLENRRLCDVVVNVQGIVHKLHRVKLSQLEYFYDLFKYEPLPTKAENCNPTSIEYSFNNVDAITFEGIIRYVYEGEIRNISETQMLGLLEASKFFKIDELYESCRSSMISNVRKTDYLFSKTFALFQFACEYERFQKLYRILVKRIIYELWPTLGNGTDFKDIPLKTLKEILAIPQLNTIKFPGEIFDLCTEWILYDFEKRFPQIIDVVRAINRGYTSKIIKAEIPTNTMTDCLPRYVRDQLNRILSSASLVPSNVGITFNNENRPRFIMVKKDGTLSFVNVQLESVFEFQLRISPHQSQPGPTSSSVNVTATMMNERLFMLINTGETVHFLAFFLDTGIYEFISLAADGKPDNEYCYIFNCRNEIYLCYKYFTYKYSVHLNRWIFHERHGMFGNDFNRWFTSDGKKIYAIYMRISNHANNAVIYDIEQKTFNNLPRFPSSEIGNKPIKAVNFINNELAILFEHKTLVLNSKSQTWSIFNHLSSKNFIQYTQNGFEILYVSDKNEIYSFSPFHNTWTEVKKLSDDIVKVITIHTI